jgi:parallel beta-helix repeat protein
VHRVPFVPRLRSRVHAIVVRVVALLVKPVVVLLAAVTVGALGLTFAMATVSDRSAATLSSSPDASTSPAGDEAGAARPASRGSGERAPASSSGTAEVPAASEPQPPVQQEVAAPPTPAATGAPAPGAPPAAASSSATPPAPARGTPAAAASSTYVPPANSLRPPASIATDCSADVTNQLTAWVDSVPDHSAILFAADSCYLVNGSITVTRKTGLIIDGNGSTFKATQLVASPETNRAQWHLNYGSDITLRNMELVGVHPPTQRYDGAYEYDHNVFIRGTDGVLVDRIDARNAYGDNLTITQGLDWTTIPGHITITNSVFDGAGRNALSCVACHDVTVDGNAISNTAMFSFDLEIEGDNWPGRNVRFTNNVISGELGGAMFSIGAPRDWSGEDISDIYIAGNKMTTFSNGSFDCYPAISLQDSKSHVRGMVIENNELYSISDGIIIKDASDVTVRNNVIHSERRCGSSAAVTFIGVSAGQVSGNVAPAFAVPHRESGGE